MANLPVLSLAAPEIRLRLGDGRANEAVDLIVAELRAGHADPEVQALAAAILSSPPDKRKSRFPMRWLEIGREYENALGQGMKKTAAYAATAVAVQMSEKHVRDALKFYFNIPSELR